MLFNLPQSRAETDVRVEPVLIVGAFETLALSFESQVEIHCSLFSTVLF